MNRIILMGNGFDLAHGMKTSYSDFLNHYWAETIIEIQKSPIDLPFENNDVKISHPLKWHSNEHTYKTLELTLQNNQAKLEFKNVVLEIITKKSYIQNWVDVEHEYYALLKKTYRKQVKYDIFRLNSDFEVIKLRLIKYLKKVFYDFEANSNGFRLKRTVSPKIFSYFKMKDFTQNYLNHRAEEEYSILEPELKLINDGVIKVDELDAKKQNIINRILGKDYLKEINEILKSDMGNNYFDLVPDEILYLNFNYTYTEDLYPKPEASSMLANNPKLIVNSNHIHGSLDEVDSNPIIFGYGDELDDDYKDIEKLNNNEYLHNIKSIRYLEADYYKKLLEFIESDNYQIFIFGHSCGISDRTLLNTMFEHRNCVSIKPFYHKINRDEDNYSEIVRNISRNFNNKVEMRDKVVNKKYCEALNE